MRGFKKRAVFCFWKTLGYQYDCGDAESEKKDYREQYQV